jgi:hypothetical protein
MGELVFSPIRFQCLQGGLEKGGVGERLSTSFCWTPPVGRTSRKKGSLLPRTP